MHRVQECPKLAANAKLRVGYVRILELRLQNGRHFHPRLGIKKGDMWRGVAVVQPFVQRYSDAQRNRMCVLFGDDDSDAEEESWAVDWQRTAPVLLQLSSLGRRVDMLDLDECGTFTLGAVFDGSGGTALRACTLAPGLFCATAMVEEKVDLMRMTVAQLRSELAARGGASAAGQLKSVLRGRLRALIIARHTAPPPAVGKRQRQDL
tara:strand:- start:125 stop:745 length:621 start_codon:yes stop_codon:yes gene_type:complete